MVLFVYPTKLVDYSKIAAKFYLTKPAAIRYDFLVIDSKQPNFAKMIAYIVFPN
jgi:hypothetical protein